MAKKIQLVPTILTYSLVEFKKRLKKLEPYFNLAQIDCADGKFVGNKTFYDFNKVKKVKTKVDYELHLMVNEPLKEIKKWERFSAKGGSARLGRSRASGGNKVKSIIFHFEAVKSGQEILAIIKYLHQKGIKAGLAINPQTRLEKVIKFLPLIDILLFLGVKPGWGGQKFQPRILVKIKQARKLFSKLNIEVDGGVNCENAKEIIKSGANILAVGKALFTAKDIKVFKLLNC